MLLYGRWAERNKKASSASKNIVVSPAALVAAQYLEKTFGTPYEISYPLAGELIPEMDYTGKENSGCTPAGDRRFYSKRTAGARGAEIVQVADWFYDEERTSWEEGDVFLRDEDDYIEVVENGDFDIIFADECV